MNERERVLAILKGQKPDLVPWYADLDYWMAYLRSENLMLEKLKGNGIYQLNRDLGTGFYLQGYCPFREIPDYEVKTELQGNQKITRVITPHGEIRQVEEWMPDAYCWAWPEKYVKSWKDFKALQYMFEHTHYEPDYQLAQDRKELIGDNGIVLCYLPRSPFMVTAVLLAGINVISYALMDAPEVFDETMTVLTQSLDKASEIAVNSPAECLMIPDNISSEMVGKRLYKEYVLPFHQRWTERIRKAGKISCVHIDGTLKGLVREIADAGFDFLEAMTPHPVGDIPVEEWKNWVNEKVVMWGGIPGVYFTDLCSDEDFDAFVIRLLKTMTSEPRYVLGVADQVPPCSRWERIARVRPLVEKYGRFS
jgi:uroporphyrinogen-III decarboxylase